MNDDDAQAFLVWIPGHIIADDDHSWPPSLQAPDEKRIVAFVDALIRKLMQGRQGAH